MTQFTYCQQSSYVVGWALHGYTRLSLTCHVLAVTRSQRCSAMPCVSPLLALFALSLSVSLLHPQRPIVCIRECKREDRTTAQQVAQRIELDRCTRWQRALEVLDSAGSGDWGSKSQEAFRQASRNHAGRWSDARTRALATCVLTRVACEWLGGWARGADAHL